MTFYTRVHKSHLINKLLAIRGVRSWPLTDTAIELSHTVYRHTTVRRNRQPHRFTHRMHAHFSLLSSKKSPAVCTDSCTQIFSSPLTTQQVLACMSFEDWKTNSHSLGTESNRENVGKLGTGVWVQSTICDGAFIVVVCSCCGRSCQPNNMRITLLGGGRAFTHHFNSTPISGINIELQHF